MWEANRCCLLSWASMSGVLGKRHIGVRSTGNMVGNLKTGLELLLKFT